MNVQLMKKARPYRDRPGREVSECTIVFDVCASLNVGQVWESFFLFINVEPLSLQFALIM